MLQQEERERDDIRIGIHKNRERYIEKKMEMELQIYYDDDEWNEPRTSPA